MIRIIGAENKPQNGKNAADVMTEVIKAKNDAVLGLATGSSPIEMYDELVARNKAGKISFRNIKTVNGTECELSLRVFRHI